MPIPPLASCHACFPHPPLSSISELDYFSLSPLRSRLLARLSLTLHKLCIYSYTARTQTREERPTARPRVRDPFLPPLRPSASVLVSARSMHASPITRVKTLSRYASVTATLPPPSSSSSSSSSPFRIFEIADRSSALKSKLVTSLAAQRDYYNVTHVICDRDFCQLGKIPTFSFAHRERHSVPSRPLFVHRRGGGGARGQR